MRRNTGPSLIPASAGHCFKANTGRRLLAQFDKEAERGPFR
ncbi:hypothetical protein SAMCFNEI73_pC0129 (plasmid) [Sinorhizobium americanum]|uniref:Uncharacterized protein n=1 Tax=Sinorhizobium americanum TaxID=194963 RepID=A0A1L3LUZ6_9HYPH|nr:hypothetical protein SAMCFNEI73_pC0129 [Sinorhizobium americanum]